jgi:hypothetical protein
MRDMKTVKSLYSTFGVPLLLAYLFLLSKPLGQYLINQGICKTGNDLCTGSLGLLIFFGIILIVGTGIDGIKSQLRNKIEIEPLNNLDHDFAGDFDRENKWVTHKFYAALKISNKEDSEVTNLYAVLKKATISGINHFTGSEGKRLKWKDNQGKNNCEIAIGARTGEAILYVYKFFIRDDGNNSTISTSDFDCCEGDQKQIIRLLPVSKYEIEIEFYGKLDGKDIKINSFIGFVDVIVSQTENTINFPIRIYSGKHVKNKPAT